MGNIIGNGYIINVDFVWNLYEKIFLCQRIQYG